MKFGHDNEEYWAKVSHDPLADEIKEAPRRNTRSRRKCRYIKIWQALLNEAADPTLEVNYHSCANKHHAKHGDVKGTPLLNSFKV